MTVLYKRGDQHPAFTSTLESPPGTALPLTGTTVRFLMRSIKGNTPPVNAVATIVDVLGKVSYAWGPSDLAVVGKYRVEWEITYGDGTRLTVPNDSYIDLEVLPDLS